MNAEENPIHWYILRSTNLWNQKEMWIIVSNGCSRKTTVPHRQKVKMGRNLGIIVPSGSSMQSFSTDCLNCFWKKKPSPSHKCHFYWKGILNSLRDNACLHFSFPPATQQLRRELIQTVQKTVRTLLAFNSDPLPQNKSWSDYSPGTSKLRSLHCVRSVARFIMMEAAHNPSWIAG